MNELERLGVPPKYTIKTVFAPNVNEEYKKGYFKGMSTEQITC